LIDIDGHRGHAGLPDLALVAAIEWLEVAVIAGFVGRQDAIAADLAGITNASAVKDSSSFGCDCR